MDKAYVLIIGYHNDQDDLEAIFSSFKLARDYLSCKFPKAIVFSENPDSGYYYDENYDFSIYSAEIDPKP